MSLVIALSYLLAARVFGRPAALAASAFLAVLPAAVARSARALDDQLVVQCQSPNCVLHLIL